MYEFVCLLSTKLTDSAPGSFLLSFFWPSLHFELIPEVPALDSVSGDDVLF